MHTSFTGSTRKPRQVNLSGRHVANPWAAVSGGAKTTQSSGAQNTLAHAQADRLRRQQERDRINAAKRIQKTWRGHSSRIAQKQKWRAEFDARERRRLSLEGDIRYDDPALQTQTNVPYRHEDCLSQMELLCRFLEVRNHADTLRLLFFGRALNETLEDFSRRPIAAEWTRALRRLARLFARQMEYSASITSQNSSQQVDLLQLLRLGTRVARLTPQEIVEDAAIHFHSLQHVLRARKTTPDTRSALADYTATILSADKADSLWAYTAFASEMLTTPEIKNVPMLLNFLKTVEHQQILSRAITQKLFANSGQRSVEGCLWILSYLIYIRRMDDKKGLVEGDVQSFPDWIQAISALLSYCANEIAERIEEADHSMSGAEKTGITPLDSFVQEQVSSLARQESIQDVMAKLRTAGGRNVSSVSSMAKPMANYAVALLRAFPTRATNIRMWLYRSSPSTGTSSLSTIQYLWQAAQSTGVFQKIAKDQRSVMSVLTEAAPEHNQIGRPQVSASEIATWQEEWRIILLFLELYTFILKLMDDEEFFALDGKRTLSSTRSQFQQGALPTKDVAGMTMFLKNLAFSLYWYASELVESNEVEEAGGISVLFGATPTDLPAVPEKKLQTLAGNGVSQVYLKGLVTGLLRMLHERDSRRKFLPEGHWLMTGQVDMQGFIPAVVAEEERRHADLGDDDDDEEGQETSEGDVLDADAIDSTIPDQMGRLFGIRAPHRPRMQTSRAADVMAKRRDKARRKRQLESVAPRLEILRNLPFFIPFETRVQIFRGFIYRDQLRRRNGMVDPDDWRMSVANSTQGRGPDGRPLGMERIGRHHANIRRGWTFTDAFESFYELGEELKEPIQISFIDKFGSPEAGIDGGGVTKEFLMSVTSEAFEPNGDFPFFVENEQRYLYPNPTIYEATADFLQKEGVGRGTEDYSVAMNGLLRRYEFLGRIVGKCMYEGILVDIVFAGFFLLKWALTGGTTQATNETGYRASINDLRDFDEELYQGLLKLKNYDGDVENDFGLNFTVTDEVKYDGRTFTVTKDLMRDGSNIAVTSQNRPVYIDRITRYRLQQQPALVTNAFLKGLGQIIQPLWLAMFNQRELQKLVGGDNAELDITDLRRNTQYGGLYVIGDDGLEHPTVALFWKVLKQMSDADRRKVLKFVTSTPRAPLLGFSHLNPKFSIRDSSEDQTRLPSTSTCVNLLKLPRYGDEATMRDKLLYAVNSGAGFDLS